MDEYEHLFEDFLEMIEQIAQKDDEDGRIRILSKDPRYAEDVPKKVKHTTTQNQLKR